MGESPRRDTTMNKNLIQFVRRTLTLVVCVSVMVLSVTGIARAGQSHAVAVRSTSSLHRTVTIRLYYIALSDNGKSGARVGCGDSLVAVHRVMPATTAPLTAALRLLLSDHHRTY